jgi:hypothetical protein
MPSNESFTLSEEVMEKIRNADPESAARIEQVMMSEGIRDKFDPVRQAIPLSPPFAPVDPYAPTEWGQPTEQDFRCPSGQLCRVRRVDMMDLLGGGLLNNLDFVTKIVNEEHVPNAAVGPKAREAKALSALSGSGPKEMEEFRKAIDGVVLRVVVKPSLWPIPPEGEARVDGCVYVDSIAFTDKVEIFNWAVSGKGNVKEIQQFREDANESVGTVEHGKVVPTETVDLPESVKSD